MTMKLSRKKKIFLLFSITVLVIAGFLAWRIDNSKKCVDIIGDGYGMGLDPEPVIIGNTCD